MSKTLKHDKYNGPFKGRRDALAQAILTEDDAGAMLKRCGYVGVRSPQPWLNVYFDEAAEAERPHPKLVCVDGERLAELAGAEDSEPEAQTFALERSEWLERAMLEALTPREERVIRLRFIYDETLEQVGQAFGVTRDRINQIEDKACRKLAKWLRNHAKAIALTPNFGQERAIARQLRDDLERRLADKAAQAQRDAEQREQRKQIAQRVAAHEALCMSAKYHRVLGVGAVVTIKNTDVNFSDALGLVLREGETWRMHPALARRLILNGHADRIA